jgi:hypothetical protein
MYHLARPHDRGISILDEVFISRVAACQVTAHDAGPWSAGKESHSRGIVAEHFLFAPNSGLQAPPSWSHPSEKGEGEGEEGWVQQLSRTSRQFDGSVMSL